MCVVVNFSRKKSRLGASVSYLFPITDVCCGKFLSQNIPFEGLTVSYLFPITDVCCGKFLSQNILFQGLTVSYLFPITDVC